MENQHIRKIPLSRKKGTNVLLKYNNNLCYPGNYRSRQRWKKVFQTHLSHTLVITQSIFEAGYLCETINHIFKIHLLKSYTRLDLQREEFQQRESFTFSLGNDIKGHWTEIGDKLSFHPLSCCYHSICIFLLWTWLWSKKQLELHPFFLFITETSRENEHIEISEHITWSKKN